VEFGEIESALRLHPDVREAVVTTRQRAADDVQLIAYVLPAMGLTPSPATLQEYIARVLPAYMVPAEIITVAQFQMNANGKIDRRALPQQPLLDAASAGADGEVLQGTEAVIARIWCELLGLNGIDRHRNIFHLGAHSLLVMRCCVKIKQELSITCAPTEIFRFPTVAGIAAYVESVEMKPAADESTPLDTRNSGLSPAMQAITARRRNAWSASSAASD
jgi:arthrofactin-type cyclic lipopeptide synthetase C